MPRTPSTPPPVGDSTLPSSDQINELWAHAVEEYVSRARLSEKEKAALRQGTTPEEVLNLARCGWEQNIIERRGKNHDVLIRTVSQVLGVFDVIHAALSFTVFLSQVNWTNLMKRISPPFPFSLRQSEFYFRYYLEGYLSERFCRQLRTCGLCTI